MLKEDLEVETLQKQDYGTSVLLVRYPLVPDIIPGGAIEVSLHQ